MGLIYMRTSPSGGRYIGQTIFTEEERWKDHINEANSINNRNYNSLLNRAIRKYGPESFSIIILEDNLPIDSLNEREIYWISYYKSFYRDNNHGYNMTRGGDGHRLLDINNEELLKIWNNDISINEMANYFNCENRAIRRRLIALGITPEDIEKRKGKVISNARFNELDKEKTKNVISFWNKGYTMTEIASEVKYHRDTVRRILLKNGITKLEITNRALDRSHNSKKKPILQYDNQNNFIREWPSAADAARGLNLYTSNIDKVLKGKRNTTGGFIFKYKT